MTKLTRIRLNSLHDALFKAQARAERLEEKDEGTEAGSLGKEVNQKLDVLMHDISLLLSDDEDGSLLSRTR